MKLKTGPGIQQLLCIKNIFNGSVHSFKVGKIYSVIHGSKPFILQNEFKEEHEMSFDYLQQHFENL